MMETNSMRIAVLPTIQAEPFIAERQVDSKVRRQRIISGLEKECIEFLIRLEVLFLVIWYFRNPLQMESHL